MIYRHVRPDRLCPPSPALRLSGNPGPAIRNIDTTGEQTQNKRPLSARLAGAALSVLERGRKIMAMKMQDTVMRDDGPWDAFETLDLQAPQAVHQPEAGRFVDGPPVSISQRPH